MQPSRGYHNVSLVSPVWTVIITLGVMGECVCWVSVEKYLQQKEVEWPGLKHNWHTTKIGEDLESLLDEELYYNEF